MQQETPPAPPYPSPPDPGLEIDGDGIAWITFDDPERRQNILTEPVMRRLAEVVEEVGRLAAAGQVRVVVVQSHKPGSFIAGADVEQIAAIQDPSEGERAARLGQAVYLDLERLSVPTVAAIDGVCLGGGTELALACRYRVCSDGDDTRIGLPEVQLGLLPAWGGTARLPRLVGLQAALGMLLTGDAVGPEKARRIGLVSEVLPHPRFRERVRDFAVRATTFPAGASRRKRGLLKRLAEDTPPGRKAILLAARRRVEAKTGGHYPAPLRILEVLGKGLGRPLERHLELEARAAGELITGSVCKNLLHVFQLRERAKKDARVPGATRARPVEAMGVVGAGVMGGGIAQLAAYRDVPVRMKDIRHDAVASGLKHARTLFDGAVRKGRLERREAERKMELITGGVEYHGFAPLDLVVEAVVERMDVKRSVLRETEAVVEESCILATNTSSLSVDEMASGLEHPERFAGMHFFNPVHRMPLVEVVRGKRTDDVTVKTIHRFARELGKTPVVCGDGPGFLVNRILGPYLNEAGWLLADGASVESVDAAAEAFGMPVGPLRLIDEIGLDIARHAGETLHEAFGERLAPAPPLIALGETERLGRKNGRGFYEWDEGKPDGVDDRVYQDLGPSIPAERKRIARDEMRMRLVLAMVNEAARVLDDGVVDRAGDVDLAMVMGTGFPPFRGGLLRFADDLHPRQVVARLEALRDASGTRFEPAPVLRTLSEKDRTFYQVYGS